MLTEAEQFVRMVYPNFIASKVDFHDGRESIVCIMLFVCLFVVCLFVCLFVYYCLF